MSERNIAAVVAMLEGWKRLDADGVTENFADDIVFREAPNDHDLHGKAAVRQQVVSSLARFTGYDYKMLALGASDHLVFAERKEFVTVPTGHCVEVSVLGVFEFNQTGQIVAWRDYWDTAPFAKAPAQAEAG